MRCSKYIILIFVVLLFSSCKSSDTLVPNSNKLITLNTENKLAISGTNNSLTLYYDIRNKTTNELIGNHEISLQQEGNNYIINEKRFLKKEFLRGLAKDLTNVKKYILNSKYSIVNLTEKEYLDTRERLTTEVETKISENAVIITKKSSEHIEGSKDNTINEEFAYPKDYVISSGSYFQIPYLINNVDDKYIFNNSLDGNIKSYINLGEKDISNSVLGKIKSILVANMNNRVKVWIDTKDDIVAQIEEYITKETILVTTLVKIENQEGS